MVNLAPFVLLSKNIITTDTGELPKRIDDAHFLEILFENNRKLEGLQRFVN